VTNGITGKSDAFAALGSGANIDQSLQYGIREHDRRGPACADRLSHLPARAKTAPEKAEAVGDFPLRCFEATFAFLVLFFTLPLQLFIALLIKIDSPGSALFMQYRLSKDTRPFKFVKFRTMYVDARERFPDLYAYNYNAQEIECLCFKVQNDPRVTRFGRWLRKTSLDELPNFWNVLTGDMALVGPRPEIPEMLPYYRGDDLLKFAVRPGVTGFAQTDGRGHLSFRETVRMDVAYVKARSLSTDIRVMIRTAKMVLTRRGAF